MLAMLANVSVFAQDDDMYFTPSKDKVAEEQPKTSSYSYIDEDESEGEYRSGAMRDVDEYNRRGNYGSDYSKQPMYDDSVTISRQEYEDFAYSRQMERFDDYNGRFTLIVRLMVFSLLRLILLGHQLVLSMVFFIFMV